MVGGYVEINNIMRKGVPKYPILGGGGREGPKQVKPLPLLCLNGIASM